MRDSRRTRAPSEDSSIREVALTDIRESDRLQLRHPPYPGIEDLAEQVRVHGQTTPMFVRAEANGTYTLISGYRRKAALEALNIPTALVRVFQLDDRAAYDLAVSENQHRNALSELERAYVCLRLSEDGRTQAEIANRMGWSAELHVRRYLRLAQETTPALREHLQNRAVSLRAALVFLSHGTHLSDAQQRAVLEETVRKEPSSDELRRMLLRLSKDARRRLIPPREPLKQLKSGGFIVRTIRLDAKHASGIHRGIDVLKEALRKARRLEKQLAAPEIHSERSEEESTS